MKRVWRAGFAILVAGLIWVSLVPKTGVPAGTDKSLHLVAYLGVTAVGLLGWTNLQICLAVLFGMITLGGLLELAQSMIPGRHGDVADFGANLAGSLLAAAAIVLWRKLLLPGWRDASGGGTDR